MPSWKECTSAWQKSLQSCSERVRAHMRCPNCQGHAPVTDSREWTEHTRKRRYRCRCGARFTTVEQVISMGLVRPSLDAWRRSVVRDVVRAKLSELMESI